MTAALGPTMREILAGWQGDLDPAWQPVVGGGELGYDAIDPALTSEAWEPVFTARRGADRRSLLRRVHCRVAARPRGDRGGTPRSRAAGGDRRSLGAPGRAADQFRADAQPLRGGGRSAPAPRASSALAPVHPPRAH